MAISNVVCVCYRCFPCDTKISDYIDLLPKDVSTCLKSISGNTMLIFYSYIHTMKIETYI